jgi:prepilin-type N-terminal cleavage/methylation domain-containing protein
MPARFNQRPRRPGFTLTEVMVVMGLIVVILAILLPALSSVRTQSIMSNSMANMRQVAAFMQMYAGDNREIIVPSRFDYSASPYPGKVRSEIPPGDPSEVGVVNQGTWADILWTENSLGPVQPMIQQDADFAYEFAVPDRAFYQTLPSYRGNPFRAAGSNRRDYTVAAGNPGTGPKPYGTGANESGLPGFFAANNFFDARPDADPDSIGRWFVTGQIRTPARSMYLVDSYAGSVIDPEGEPYNNLVDSDTGYRSIEVDFRYSGVALMLFMDGHIDPVNAWDDLDDLEERGIRIRSLDRRFHE